MKKLSILSLSLFVFAMLMLYGVDRSSSYAYAQQSTQPPVITPTPTPTPSPTPIPTPTPVPVFEKRKQDEFLYLVNWDNPLDDKYVPENLVRAKRVLGDIVAYNNDNIKLDKTAAQAALEMFKAAKADNVEKFLIASGYRSIKTQYEIEKARLKKNPDYYSDPYTKPVKAMKHNTSEHTTGLAIDILTVRHRISNDAYETTQGAEWLRNNAYRFGFILRYDKGKEHITGVIYEPWHFRYVGKEYSEELHELDMCLEEYVKGATDKPIINKK